MPHQDHIVFFRQNLVHVLQKLYGCCHLFIVCIYKNVEAVLGFSFGSSNWKGREWKHFTEEDVLQSFFPI